MDLFISYGSKEKRPRRFPDRAVISHNFERHCSPWKETDFVNLQALWSTCVLSTYVPSTILVSESSPRKAKDMVPFLEMPLACSKK